MDMITGFFSAIQPKNDGDTVDRLSYYYTSGILTIFAVFIFGWSFVGQPIQCWFPAYYKGWWVEYAHDYCYVQNTYFLPFTKEPVTNYWELASEMVQIPRNVTDRDDRQIGYYQWVPFILALEAALFYFPVVLWRALYKSTGIDVETITDTASNAENMKPDTRKTNIAKISKYLDHTLLVSEGLHHGLSGALVGRFVLILFLVTKFLFAVNCVAQFFMLQYFLGLEDSYWGATVLGDLIAGREWIETSHFPRVTMCDFEVKVMGNLHRHTVQCVLMINMFNEKIFVFLWWWFLVAAVVTVLSFLYWIARTLFDPIGSRLIANYLGRIDPKLASNPRRKQLIQLFVGETLRNDGVFLLRLIALNAGDVVANDLVAAMWDNFTRKHRAAPSAPPVHLHSPKEGEWIEKPPLDEYPTMPAGGYNFPPKYDLDQPDQPRESEM